MNKIDMLKQNLIEGQIKQNKVINKENQRLADVLLDNVDKNYA
jgi:hypothetical protein